MSEKKHILPALNKDQEILRDLYERLSDGSFLHDLSGRSKVLLQGCVLLIGAVSGQQGAQESFIATLDTFAEVLQIVNEGIFNDNTP